MQKGLSVLKDIFNIDLRSLALFRILVGLCLFVDIVYRIPLAYDFYSDQGVLPREVLVSKFMNVWEISVFLISGQTFTATILLVVAAISALCLAIGFYTRVAAVVCWVLVFSMHTRLGVILHGGDDVFRVLLFWMQFVPISSCYSIDSYLNKTKIEDYKHLSWGGVGLFLQLIYVYLFSGILKIHPVWITDGTGIYYALSLEQFSSTFGQWLLSYPTLMQVMSYATVGLELLGPILLLSPIRFLRQRGLIACAFIGFHFGLILTMHLGMFPWLCMAAWTMMFPEAFWNKCHFWTLSPISRIAGVLQSFQISSPAPKLAMGRFLNAVALVFIGLITTWNIYEIDNLKLKKPLALRWVMSVSEMHQRWSMFAPYPRKDDGWYLIKATLFDGTELDPFQEDHVLHYEKPKDVAATFKNTMWRKYLTNTWLKSHYDYRLYFGRYLCRKWNTRQELQERKINTIHINYMVEMTPPPGSTEPEHTQELIWRHYCYDKPAEWDDEF